MTKKKPVRRAVTRSGPPPVTRAEFDALMADLRVVAGRLERLFSERRSDAGFSGASAWSYWHDAVNAARNIAERE